jgi:hypothetical protein
VNNEPVAAVLQLVNKHISTIKSVRVLITGLIEVKSHPLAAMLGLLSDLFPSAHHNRL